MIARGPILAAEASATRSIDGGSTGDPSLAAPARRNRYRIVAAVAATTVALLSVPLTPAAAAGRQVSITVSPATAAPGDTVTISGSHPVAADCAPGAARLTSTADLFPPDGFGPRVPSDADGDFSMTYTIPDSTPLGSYEVGMRCGGGNLGAGSSFSVIRTGTTTTTEPATTSTATTTEPTSTESPRATPTPAATTATPASDARTSNHGSGPLVVWLAIVVVVLGVSAGAVAYIARRRAST